jgi:hypothetical protein
MVERGFSYSSGGVFDHFGRPVVYRPILAIRCVHCQMLIIEKIEYITANPCAKAQFAIYLEHPFYPYRPFGHLCIYFYKIKNIKVKKVPDEYWLKK